MNNRPEALEGASGQRWHDCPRTADRITVVLVFACILLFFIDALYTKHAYFAIEHIFGFYGVFGFVVCVGAVLVAGWLRFVVRRPENWYDEAGHD
ncbi:MAG: hypothetical protein KDF64_13760 [Geminicoccaceae bacterium]|nr:hypothetical protein [Geminicoccaceae bacterium]